MFFFLSFQVSCPIFYILNLISWLSFPLYLHLFHIFSEDNAKWIEIPFTQPLREKCPNTKFFFLFCISQHLNNIFYTVNTVNIRVQHKYGKIQTWKSSVFKLFSSSELFFHWIHLKNRNFRAHKKLRKGLHHDSFFAWPFIHLFVTVNLPDFFWKFVFSGRKLLRGELWETWNKRGFYSKFHLAVSNKFLSSLYNYELVIRNNVPKKDMFEKLKTFIEF